jgi:hypothetical protein
MDQEENPYRAPLSRGGTGKCDSSQRRLLPRLPKSIRSLVWFGLLVLGATTTFNGLGIVGLTIASFLGVVDEVGPQVMLPFMMLGIVLSSLGGFLTVRALKRLGNLVSASRLTAEKETK